MVEREASPQCGSRQYKRNGYIHAGKQNHKCKVYGRVFVLLPDNRVITDEQRALIERLLRERISLRGIRRAMGVSVRWLLHFMGDRFDAAPDHLYVEQTAGRQAVILHRLEAKVDELWSFGGEKANRQWIWIAIDVNARQVITCHVGDRSRQNAEQLWQNIPAVYRAQAAFYADLYEAHKGVVSPAQHHAISKQVRQTNHIERFNCTLRQRVSRPVRATPPFSKRLADHIGAIRYFICD